jgi:hypothetical protein
MSELASGPPPVEGLRNFILEAVEHLRLKNIKKPRPARESIAHYVMVKHHVRMNDSFMELENMVEDGLLLKLQHNYFASYITPENYENGQKDTSLIQREQNYYRNAKILNSSRTSELILAAIKDLVAGNPEYVKPGVPFEELKAKLMQQDPKRFSEPGFDLTLHREVAVGNVIVGKEGRLHSKETKPQRRVDPNKVQYGWLPTKSTMLILAGIIPPKAPKKKVTPKRLK